MTINKIPTSWYVLFCWILAYILLGMQPFLQILIMGQRQILYEPDKILKE